MTSDLKSFRDFLLNEGRLKRVATPKVLFHGTLKSNMLSIRQRGLVPKVGEFTKTVWSDPSDEFSAVYATSKRNITWAFSAIVGQLLKKGIRPNKQNVKKHGVLFVLNSKAFPHYRYGFWENPYGQSTRAKKLMGAGKIPRVSSGLPVTSNAVEPTNYFSTEPVDPSHIKHTIRGDDLVDLFEKHGFGEDEIRGLVNQFSSNHNFKHPEEVFASRWGEHPGKVLGVDLENFNTMSEPDFFTSVQHPNHDRPISDSQLHSDLKAMTKMADYHGVDLNIHSDNEFNPITPKQRAIYQQHGFELDGEDDGEIRFFRKAR